MPKNASGAGRPAAPDTTNSTPEERATAHLQYAMDRANSFICDAPTTSVVAKAAKCARAGVPIKIPEKALAAIRTAVDDAETAIQAAYAAPKKVVSAKSRATL